LRYGNFDVTKEEVEKLLEDLGANNFIDGLAKGIDTKLEDNGSNISVGQRQLLAIARLLLRKPKILILDEATANIDTRTEKLVQNAIEYAIKDVTSFVIAHRLSTIKNADVIILIQNNTILESGSHEELMSKKGKYFEMYSKFEGDKV
jgi:ATP-binding cassette subfamily B protein